MPHDRKGASLRTDACTRQEGWNAAANPDGGEMADIGARAGVGHATNVSGGEGRSLPPEQSHAGHVESPDRVPLL